MKVLIVSGGMAPSTKLLNEEINDHTIIIAVDSGANCLYRENIVPHYLLGDFDSIDKEAYFYLKEQKTQVVSYPSDKDYTDTQLAVLKALELTPSEIVFLGCTGSRIDHMLGNLGLLKFCSDKGVNAYIKDDNNVIYITDKNTIIRRKRGTTFSLQAYCDEVVGLNIKGARYPLNNYRLKIGDPRTISNVFAEEQVEISFEQGFLLIIYSVD